jgi:integrase
MADYLFKRDGFWHYARRVPKQYETADQQGVFKETTKIRVADDPRAIRARKVAAEINVRMERRWRDFAVGDQAQALAEYDAARKAARRLDISAPIDDAAQRTIAELLARIEKLEGKHEEDRHAVLAVYDAAPKPDITFRQCAERYIEDHRAGWKNAKHVAQWSTSLETYAYPIIGAAPVKTLTNGDGTDLIMKVLQPIWSSKTTTASRLRGRIESVLDWAKARGYRDGENPARWKGHLDKLLPSKDKVAPVKHHPAMPYADIPGFMERLRGEEGNVARALEFTVLTAARTSEVTEAKRSEIDREARMWIVPAERMKAGREHRVALCSAAMAIIDSTEGEYLFPGRTAGKPLSDSAMLKALQRLGVTGVTHGFRSAFRDWGAETTDYPNEVLEMALAHTISNKAEAAYRRGDLLQKRHDLMADWCSYCNSEA